LELSGQCIAFVINQNSFLFNWITKSGNKIRRHNTIIEYVKIRYFNKIYKFHYRAAVFAYLPSNSPHGSMKINFWTII